ncbi:branched-chain amino acid ABC transporter permease [Roseibium aquae]|uniref:Branched-chain amino acid ABC transporter permease n=1 Tax=Roseibium aquae TaxID=1323746 RepID=A0A916TNF3_9HYPH|nr:AzlC family ABC transporter permease [Roseibium aquae]GGB53030.1 branched-chain amino acid ABC transporter permease [Roseibium aquae]
MSEKPVTLTLDGCVRGARLCLPIMPGTIAFGAVFGTVCAQKGLSLLETVLINSLVFAGASQFVAMELYQAQLTFGIVVAMIGVVAAVNMRMLLIGASLRPWLGHVPGRQTYPALYFLTDINWLISLREYDRGERDWGIYLGSGLFVWVIWSCAVVPGYLAGSQVTDPAKWGLDVILPAYFVALLVPLWKGRRQTLSWFAAGAVALASWYFLGGYWGILTGAVTGALVGAYVDE